MKYHVDRLRPPVEASDIRCPKCGQTYTSIIDGFVSMPSAHYPQPTDTRDRRAVVGTHPSGGNRGRLCPISGDDLVHYLFKAQLEAGTR